MPRIESNSGKRGFPGGGSTTGSVIRSRRLSAPCPEQGAKAAPGRLRVAPQERATRRAQSVGEELGGVVECAGGSALARHHLAPAAGVQVERAGAERSVRGGPAEMAQADLRSEDRRDSFAARLQAQLHVLVEEERRRVE